MKTEQEIFNHIFNYAKGMNAPAMGQDLSCLYRSDNGPCLIGSLIKDEYYTFDLEGNDASNNLVERALILSGIELKNIRTEFLNSIQEVHDSIGSSDNYEDFNKILIENLENFAKIYNLEIPE